MASRRLLDQNQRDRLSERLPTWHVEDDRLVRAVTAPTFVDGISLVVAVAEIAEVMDHHPDIDIRWRTVTFRLVTHDVGGLTELDVELAGRIDAILDASDID